MHENAGWTRGEDGDSLAIPVMDLRSARSSIGCITVAFAVLVWLPSSPAAQTSASPSNRAIFVRAIAIGSENADAVVAIEADGPLPAPTVGALDNPPRIFLDLVGIRVKVPYVTPSGDPRIRRVRVAVHSIQPLVTRVVVDLAALQPHRIEHNGAQMKILIGGGATPPAESAAASAPIATTSALAPAPPPTPAATEPIPLVPPLPDPGPLTVNDSPGAPPVAPPAAPPPATSYKPLPIPASLRDVEKYRVLILSTVDRFRLQLPVLKTLEDREARTTEALELASLEIDRLRQELMGIKPPDSVRVPHDLLLQATRLAMMAIRLRGEALRSGDVNVMRNATSAAAGALMMFERACGEVGC
jgi:hypothetical protein